MVRQTARVLFLEIFGALLLLLLIAAAGLAFRLASGPIELRMLRDDVERAIAQARGGAPVSIGSLWLEWSPEEHKILLSARDIVLSETSGVETASATDAGIDFDATALFLGRIRVEGLTLGQGRLRVSHLGGDRWNVAGQELTIVIPAAEHFDLATLVGRVDAVAASLFRAIGPSDATIGLKTVRVSAFAVDIFDAQGARLAEIPELSGRFDAGANGALSLSVSAQSPGAGLPVALDITLATDASRDALSLTIGFSDWSLEALLERVAGRPVEGGANLGLPLSGQIALASRRETGLETFDWSFDLRQGQAVIARLPLAVKRARMEGRLDVAARTLAVKLTGLDTSRVRGDIALTVTDVFESIDAGMIPFTLSAPRLALDLTPVFERPWALRDVRLKAAIDPGKGVAVVDRLDFASEETAGRAGGRIRWKGADLEGAALPLELKASLDLDGPLGPQGLFGFWPVRAGTAAREHVRERFEAGVLSDIALRVDLGPHSLQDGMLADEALELDYRVTGARFRFLADVPPVEEGVAMGRLRGNSLTIDIRQGRVLDWNLAGGRVDISRFRPDGGWLTVSGSGSGPLVSVLRVLRDSELQLGRKEGFDINRVGGTAEGQFEIRRPVGAEVSDADLLYRVEGRVVDASLKGAVAEFDITGVGGRVDLDNERLILTGAGEMAGSGVNFAWTQKLAPEIGQRTELEASATVTPDMLNRFGLLVRAYLSGEIPVRLTGVGDGAAFSRLDFEFDLTGARLDVPEIGLLKPFGAPASASLVYNAPTAVRPALYSGQFTSEAAALEGDIRMTRENSVDEIALRRAYIATRMDVAGRIQRDPVDGIRIDLTGEYLDASGLLGGAGMMGGEGEPLSGDLALAAEVRRLTLGEGLDVRGAGLNALVRGGELLAFSARGETAPGRAFDARLTEGEDGTRRVSVTADDAGFLIQALFGTDIVEGGRLSIEGQLDDDDATTRLRLNLYDARLTRAPLFTQILSLASLQGLADTLSGEGVLFTRVEIPLAITGKRFVIAGGRASGPALGMTFNGSVDLGESREISLGGVLVPSFGVNSALGGIPIIGDLFVSRDGEGVFSVRYDVKGTLDKAQVTANLLSAVTPGVLRRIFENPEEADLEALRALEQTAPARPQPEPALPPPPPDSPVPSGPAPPG